MKLIQHFLPFALVGLLAGCAAGPQKGDDDVHASMGAMDMQTMCAMHQNMLAGKPSAEQQAMMQEHMKSMTPEMRQRMMAMQEQCKVKPHDHSREKNN